MGGSRAASAPQYAGKPDHLRGTRSSGAGCRQVQRWDGARCPIVLLESPRLCAGLCHRDSMASHGLVGHFVRRVVANPLANSVGDTDHLRIHADFVWNTRPKNLECDIEKWNEFLAA